MKYYHGGPSGLTKISPPSVTGAAGLNAYGTGHISRRDRVYVTTSFEAAAMYAVGYPYAYSVVYEVAPVFPLEHDPDCSETGLSYCCRGAKVIREIDISPQLRNAIMLMLTGQG